MKKAKRIDVHKMKGLKVARHVRAMLVRECPDALASFDVESTADIIARSERAAARERRKRAELAQKVVKAQLADDRDKALHHKEGI